MTPSFRCDEQGRIAMTTKLKVALGVFLVVLVIDMGLVERTEAALQLAPTDTLILVNSDPITVAYVDKLVLKAHKTGKMEQGGTGLVYRYLEKRVNDLLILQDALAAGMDQEPEVLDFVAEKELQYSIQAYVRDHLVLPKTAPEDSVRAFFDRFYWQIQIRQLSVRTETEADDLRTKVLGGADMDSLAKEFSLDTKKLRGGLSNLLYWADVENVIRDQVRNLQVGDLSPVFPFREAYAFVRVEQLLPVDEAAFSKVQAKTASSVLAVLRQRAWDEFVSRTLAEVPVTENMDVLFAMAADSASVLNGDFLKKNERPALAIAGGPVVTETELRKAVSHEAMTDAMRPFATIMSVVRRDKKREIALGYLAEQAGYVTRDDVQERIDQDWEDLLIETYLNEAVAAKIRFKREEFQEFYTRNLDQFRGPDEVRLEILILDSETDAKEASQKLAGGADFSYVFGQYNPGVDFSLGKSSYIKTNQLSRQFRDQLSHMKVGQSSEAVSMPMGWMVFQLADQRPGTPPPLEEVEMDIRKAIYQEKFNVGMNEVLGKLKEHSRITRFEDRIDAYFNPTQED